MSASRCWLLLKRQRCAEPRRIAGGDLRERVKCWQTVSFQFKHVSALESACGALVEPWDRRAASGAGTECRKVLGGKTVGGKKVKEDNSDVQSGQLQIQQTVTPLAPQLRMLTNGQIPSLSLMIRYSALVRCLPSTICLLRSAAVPCRAPQMPRPF